MKNPIRYYVFAGLVAALTLAEGDVFAQTKWAVKQIDIAFPVMATYRYYSNDSNEPYDSASHTKTIVTFTNGVMSSYKQSADSVEITIGDFCGGTGSEKMTFVIDTNSRSLLNFQIAFHGLWCSDDIWIKNDVTDKSITFTSLNYTFHNDSLLEVNVGSAACRDNVKNVKYSYSRQREASEPFTVILESARLDSLISQDTDSYRCILTFDLKKQLNAVLWSNSLQKIFEASNYLPDHTIHFFFPSGIHPQTMSLFDILGREISKIEIPSGSTSYVLQSAGFPKGTYFARLGSSSAHFVVN